MRSFIGVFITFLIFPSLIWADTLDISSTAFGNNVPIPAEYTCDDANINPPLIFNNVPAQTQSLLVTVSDPDAPRGTWTHWILYNIPADTKEIMKNSRPGMEGLNDFGKNAYGGPCPPPGKAHRYIFHLYALDTLLNPEIQQTLSDIKKDIQGHILAESRLVGTYQK